MTIELVNAGPLQSATRGAWDDRQEAEAKTLTLSKDSQDRLVGVLEHIDKWRPSDAERCVKALIGDLNELCVVLRRWSNRDDAFEELFGAHTRPDTRSFDADDLAEMHEEASLRG